MPGKHRYHHSPDEYNDTSIGGEVPGRKAYEAKPTNVTRAETSKKAGGTPGAVQQSEGTDNKRADNKTKSSTRNEAGSGKTRWPNVDSYDDTKDF